MCEVERDIEFIGQEELKDYFLTSPKIETFPGCMLVIGEPGSGKKTFVRYLAQEYGMEVIEFNKAKVDDIRIAIELALTLQRHTIFLFSNADYMTLGAQNALLKLAEEPYPKTHIVMTVADMEYMLPTIISRCHSVNIREYSKQDLAYFNRDQRILEVCRTPGDIIKMEQVGAAEVYQFAFKVYENIDKISTLNAFAIAKNVSFEEGKPGIPVDLFVRVLQVVSRSSLGNPLTANMITVLSMWQYRFRKYRGVNKLAMFDQMMLEMQVAKGGLKK